MTTTVKSLDHLTSALDHLTSASLWFWTLLDVVCNRFRQANISSVLLCYRRVILDIHEFPCVSWITISCFVCRILLYRISPKPELPSKASRSSSDRRRICPERPRSLGSKLMTIFCGGSAVQQISFWGYSMDIPNDDNCLVVLDIS